MADAQRKASRNAVFKNVFVNSRLETGLLRKGRHWRTEMVIIHLPAPFLPLLTIATFRLDNNPNANPSEMVELSLEDARQLRAFLNRPEVMKWLGQEEGEAR